MRTRAEFIDFFWCELERRKWTLKDLAKKAFISYSHCQRIFASRHIGSLEAYVAILDALDMELQPVPKGQRNERHR